MTPVRFAARPHAEALLPAAIRRRITDRPLFSYAVARYTAMSLPDLLQQTSACLRNLGRLDDLRASADADLRCVLVPELWARLIPGTRTDLRWITTRLAEHRSDGTNFFRLSEATRAVIRASAEDLRHRVAAAADLDTEALVEQTRFAIAGSRAKDAWAPDDSVYEPGFAYRLVPVVACRVLALARSSIIPHRGAEL